MNAWLVLIPATILFIVGAFFTYRDDLRNGQWYIPVIIIDSILACILWIWAARLLDDKNKIFLLSLLWDLSMVTCYYLLPLLILDFKMTRAFYIGSALILSGLFVIKTFGGK